jgi:hypothetical protein
MLAAPRGATHGAERVERRGRVPIGPRQSRRARRGAPRWRRAGSTARRWPRRRAREPTPRRRQHGGEARRGRKSGAGGHRAIDEVSREERGAPQVCARVHRLEDPEIVGECVDEPCARHTTLGARNAGGRRAGRWLAGGGCELGRGAARAPVRIEGKYTGSCSIGRSNCCMRWRLSPWACRCA